MRVKKEVSFQVTLNDVTCLCGMDLVEVLVVKHVSEENVAN